MKKSESIIKEIITKGPSPGLGDLHIAQVKGQPIPKRKTKVRYLNLETREEYLALAGGLAWPGLQPGYAIVMGTIEKADDKPIFKAIAEIEHDEIHELIKAAYKLFLKYGQNCANVSFEWVGDPYIAYNTVTERIKSVFKRDKMPFSLTYPPYFDDPKAFQFYLKTITGLWSEGQLHAGKCPLFANHLQTVSDPNIFKSNAIKSPGIAAIGYVLTYLRDVEPWLVDIQDTGILPTIQEYQQYASAYERDAERYMLDEWWIDEDVPSEWAPNDRRELVPTVG